MPTLPTDVVAYKRTPSFTHTCVPQGLLSEHKTKADTWGVIHVEQGRLRYCVVDGDEVTRFELGPGRVGVIVPQQPHYLTLDGAVSFYVEFYRSNN